MPILGILGSPPSVFYEMVNIERAGLGWSKEQIRDFAQALIGKSDPAEFSPRDWMTLAIRFLLVWWNFVILRSPN